MNSKFHRFLRHVACAILLMFSFTACEKSKESVEPVSPFFKTGPATFVVFGGVVQTFQIMFDQIGNVPIEEYGVVYAFTADSTGKEPDINGSKAVFETPAKTGLNEKTVQIGFPVGARYLRYRAYAKLKDTELIKYAESIELSI